MSRLDEYLLQFEAAVHDGGRPGPLGARCGGGERRRLRGRPRAWRNRGREGEVADDRRDRAQRGARRRGRARARDRLRGADPAARRRLVVAHPRAGDPPQPARDPRPLPTHDRRRHACPTTPASSPRRPASTCREKFLTARMAVSGANFGVAETGTVVVVESEGNGRMCTTLPPRARHRARDREPPESSSSSFFNSSRRATRSSSSSGSPSIRVSRRGTAR